MSPAAPPLCDSCGRRPAMSVADARAATVDNRVEQLLDDPNPAVAHVAGAAVGYQRDVEGWKRLAAAETDPAKAEVYRKHGAVAVETARALAQVAQDAKAVATP